MIQPRRSERDTRRKGAAVVMAVTVLLTARAGLDALPLPAMTSSRAVIRELDPLVFARFATPDQPEVARPDSEDSPPPDLDDAPAPDLEVGRAVDALTRRFASDLPTPVVETRTRADAVPDGISGSESAAFESLFGDERGVEIAAPSVGSGPRNRPGRGSGAPGIAVRRSAAPEEAFARPTPGPGGTPVAAGAGERVRIEAPEVEVREFEAGGFSGSEAERLGDWIRANREEMPIGVRMHLPYESVFPATSVRFRSEGRQFELYLMLNPSLRELHILLVEDERSVYLIDRGFQEQSASLRAGTVRRTGDTIVAIDSEAGAASSARATEFYNIFLSWWAGVGGGDDVR